MIIHRKDLLDVVLMELPRIRQLSLVMPGPGAQILYKDSPCPWVGLQAPVLKTVDILLGHHLWFRQTVFPEIFLQSRTLPALQSFSMRSDECRWPWMSFPFPGCLTKLVICGIRWASTFQSAEETVRLLRSVPNLEHLEVNIGYDKQPDMVPSQNLQGILDGDSRYLYFPKMQTFVASGKPFVCLSLFQLLVIPSGCSIRLHLEPPDGLVCDRVVHSLNTLLFNCPTFPRVNKILWKNEECEYDTSRGHLSCWRSMSLPDEEEIPRITPLPNSDPGPHTVLTFDGCAYPDGWDIWAAVANRIIGHLCLDNVTELFVDDAMHYYVEITDFQSILSSMPSLKAMIVRRWRLDDILSLVGPVHREATGTDVASCEGFPASNEARLPHLRTVELREVSFPVRPLVSGGERFIVDWLNWLRSRMEAGVGLSVLKLDNCYNVSAGAVDPMKPYVGGIEWDKIQQPGMTSVWEDEEDEWE